MIDQVIIEVQHVKTQLSPLEKIYQDMCRRLQDIEQELWFMLKHKIFGEEFTIKEREHRELEKEVNSATEYFQLNQKS